MKLSPALHAVLLLAAMLPSIHGINERKADSTSKYKFLYFASITGASHYRLVSLSGKALVRQGHQVVSLMSSSNPDTWQKDADFFSFVVFNSSYEKQDRIDIVDNLSKLAAKGRLNSFFGPIKVGIQEHTPSKFNLLGMFLQECDDLLGDLTTMKRLQEERFDMLVADDWVPCSPLLAQALEIPFVYLSVLSVIPSRHEYWTGMPMNPSYIPEHATGLTDRMTFFQRVQNVLAHAFYSLYNHRLSVCNFDGYDQLKIKYNIKPEISTFESHKQVLLTVYHGSFGLEYPRAMQPNTVYALHCVGLDSNHTIEDDVAVFLDTAPTGVVLFSLGTWFGAMEREQLQVFADAFSALPYRVLWQTKVNLTGVQLATNIKTVRWLPLSQVMEHVNVKVYVTHGGALSMHEALWAGLPIVGIPFVEDQMDNLVRVEDRGAGISLDIASLTPGILTSAIRRVITEPGYRRNAKSISEIMRDLQTTSPPVDTVAHWILHVTKFGGDHLRPAVLDLNFLQSSLVDVYLFLGVAVTSVIGVMLSLCRFCCKCVCRKGTQTTHLKRE